MKRSSMLAALREQKSPWDIIIIGGGATGLGVAVDAASRGYKTLLLEMEDFAHGTSSRSTKLVHGGVRYLEQGNIKLVWEALKERGILLRNASHLVHRQPFVVPFYKRWKGIYYWLGLKTYDLLAGKRNIGSSEYLSSAKAVGRVPGINSEGLSGGILYYDGQFDDSRLAINLARTAADQGGVLLNYVKVTGLMKTGGAIEGVEARDEISGETFTIKGRAVVNATGVFTDSILQMDGGEPDPIIRPSQGIHIVIDKEFLESDTAVMIPETVDGRVLFAIPWHDKTMIGTTDTPVSGISNEPEAMEEEIDYILEHIAGYLTRKPSREDIRSVFAGLRPLVNRSASDDTSEISRDHTLFVRPSGLITIAGGKWTTYRKMGEDVVDRAIQTVGLEERTCVTGSLKIHGWIDGDRSKAPAGDSEDIPSQPENLGTNPRGSSTEGKHSGESEILSIYGSDRAGIEKMISERPGLGERLHHRLPYLRAEVIWATRHEMAMTVEDFCARRTRSLFIDAEAAGEIAPEVARLMADEMGQDEEWIKAQVTAFNRLAEAYRVRPVPDEH